ncbi:8412_t:CDS:2, partial [Cetraspora pellucida]
PKYEIENTIEHLIINAVSTTQYLNPVQYFNTATLTQDRIIKKIIVSSEPLLNAMAQKKAKEIINKMNEEIAKYQKDYNLTTDPEAKCELIDHIQDLKQHQQVVKYDSPGHPPLLYKYPDLLEHIHESIEFRAADSKRRKEVINVQTINHIKEELESKYNEYLSQTAINNYLLPCHSNSIEAKNYHHPTNIQVATVSRNERADHSNVYYCFASVKAARQFAALFPIFLVIMSQDDKAKVLLGISAVEKSFKVIQSNNKPVTILDYDFLASLQQKLISSVYLIIDPSDTNDTLHRGQMLIYIHPQYKIGTSLKTHMNDLYSLMNNGSFDNMLKVNNKIRPIWVLLVDRGPDKNLCYLKNISHYCNIFRSFDLDYLIIRTHAPGHSAYNPVERSMASLSTKLADVKKCNNIKCCFPKRCEEAANLLVSYNSFFLPLVMKKDGHYINSIHLLEYLDKKKILGYNQHCPSMTDNYIKHTCPICGKYFLTISMVANHKKNQHLKEACKPGRPKKDETIAKEACLIKRGPGRPKKDKTMAKETFLIKRGLGRPKNTETMTKKQKTK